MAPGPPVPREREGLLWLIGGGFGDAASRYCGGQPIRVPRLASACGRIR
jgi:hypothetical protein